MCLVVEVAPAEVFVQCWMFYSVTLWKGFIPWITLIITVLCGIKDCHTRDKRGRTMGRRYVLKTFGTSCYIASECLR